MSFGKNDDSFIAQMLNETFLDVSLRDLEPAECIGLDMYFEERLNKTSNTSEPKRVFEIENSNFLNLKSFIEKYKILSFEGKFYRKSNFIRFNLRDEILDIPCNWSIFEELMDLDIKNDSWVEINLDNDQDNLLSILSSYYSSLNELIVYTTKKSVNLLFFTETEKKIKNSLIQNFLSKEQSDDDWEQAYGPVAA